ncbi:MAG TPA: NfeD family protein [Acidimicrobiales bacterium]|nr:NfeD family protein [Acidimicrobiales bacterium]
MAMVFWALIIVACALAELHTSALVAAFIGASAVVAFALALLGVPFLVQVPVWLVVSGVLLAALRPLALRYVRHHRRQDLTLPARGPMTDQMGFVERAVGDEGHPGRVTIKGESWRAVTESGETIPDGSRVVVRRTHGTTLWVERLS